MGTTDLTRRLSAIFSADVEGYSRLMREDEEATVRTITTYRNVMINLIQQYRGRVVDSPGGQYPGGIHQRSGCDQLRC